MKLTRLSAGTSGYHEKAGSVGGQIAEFEPKINKSHAIRIRCSMSSHMCPALINEEVCAAQEYDTETGEPLDFGEIRCARTTNGRNIVRQIL